MSTLNFNTTLLFPTIIGSCINTPLAEKVLPFAKEVLDNPKNLTNAWGYKNNFSTSSNNNIPNTEIFKELESFIKDVSISFAKTLHFKKAPSNVRLFFSEMNNGDNHSTHTHPNSIFSGVFYLNAPPNSASIRFHDPRQYQNFILYDTVENPGSLVTFEIKPQKGLFLIWQSWIPHEVLKNLSNGRTTVVFNIWFS